MGYSQIHCNIVNVSSWLVKIKARELLGFVLVLFFVLGVGSSLSQIQYPKKALACSARPKLMYYIDCIHVTKYNISSIIRWRERG